MSDLTAIDILINPDETMLSRAKAANKKMLASAPQGFELDEHHQPHITTLQRYVRTADLDQVFNAVGKTIDEMDMSKLEFSAEKFAHMETEPGVGLTAIVVSPGPEVLDFQAQLIDAVKPHAGNGGTADAYVRTDAEPDINDATLKYVDGYVPDHSGPNFIAHVTVGLAKLDDLKEIEADPFDTFTFSPAGVSVYQLGNNGTAAKQLTTWSV